MLLRINPNNAVKEIKQEINSQLYYMITVFKPPNHKSQVWNIGNIELSLLYYSHNEKHNKNLNLSFTYIVI